VPRENQDGYYLTRDSLTEQRSGLLKRIEGFMNEDKNSRKLLPSVEVVVGYCSQHHVRKRELIHTHRE